MLVEEGRADLAYWEAAGMADEEMLIAGRRHFQTQQTVTDRLQGHILTFGRAACLHTLQNQQQSQEQLLL
jgi:hypothetical protein